MSFFTLWYNNKSSHTFILLNFCFSFDFGWFPLSFLRSFFLLFFFFLLFEWEFPIIHFETAHFCKPMQTFSKSSSIKSVVVSKQQISLLYLRTFTLQSSDCDCIADMQKFNARFICISIILLMSRCSVSLISYFGHRLNPAGGVVKLKHVIYWW